MRGGAHPGRHWQSSRVELGLCQLLDARVADDGCDPIVAAVPDQHVCAARVRRCAAHTAASGLQIADCYQSNASDTAVSHLEWGTMLCFWLYSHCLLLNEANLPRYFHSSPRSSARRARLTRRLIGSGLHVSPRVCQRGSRFGRLCQGPRDAVVGRPPGPVLLLLVRLPLRAPLGLLLLRLKCTTPSALRLRRPGLATFDKVQRGTSACRSALKRGRPK